MNIAKNNVFTLKAQIGRMSFSELQALRNTCAKRLGDDDATVGDALTARWVADAIHVLKTKAKART